MSPTSSTSLVTLISALQYFPLIYRAATWYFNLWMLRCHHHHHRLLGNIWYSDCDCVMEQSVIWRPHSLPQNKWHWKFSTNFLLRCCSRRSGNEQRKRGMKKSNLCEYRKYFRLFFLTSNDNPHGELGDVLIYVHRSQEQQQQQSEQPLVPKEIHSYSFRLQTNHEI